MIVIKLFKKVNKLINFATFETNRNTQISSFTTQQPNYFQFNLKANQNEKATISVNECLKDFLMSLLDKKEPYMHHINVVDGHLNRLDENGVQTQIYACFSSLLCNRFPVLFLSDDAIYNQKYNEIIEKFQIKTMNLMRERLLSRVKIIESKLSAIKSNLIKT